MKILLLVIILVCTILLYGIYTAYQYSKMDSSRLYWGVDVGTQFTYVVQVFGYNMTYVYIPENDTYSKVESSLFMMPLNNTRIIVTISNLPQLPVLTDANSFAEDVIPKIKTHVCFENGTAILQQLAILMTSLTSNILLPIGDWVLLDALYQDEDPDSPMMKTWYISKQHADSFEIGYTNYGPDYASGWSGNISQSTGIPIVGNIWRWNAIEEYSYSVYITPEL